MSSSASGGNSVSLSVPATTTAIKAFTKALAKEYLCELKVYEFDSRLSNVVPQSGQSLIVSFLGVITDMGGDFTTLNINLGSSLSPVGAQAPPRKMTTYLAGVPIRL